SIHRRLGGRSRSPARSAISTSASRASGARPIRGLLPGSTIFLRACRPSRPRCRRRGKQRFRRMKTRTPQALPGAFFDMFRTDSGSEAIVEPATRDVAGERGVVAGKRPAAKAAIDVAKVDVEVFGLCGPGSEQSDLESGADSPTEIRVILADIAWRVRADIADGH